MEVNEESFKTVSKLNLGNEGRCVCVESVWYLSWTIDSIQLLVLIIGYVLGIALNYVADPESEYNLYKPVI